MKTNVNLETEVTSLPGKKWSLRAQSVLQDRTVFRLFLKHMLNGGVHYDGFGFRVDGVGMGTYQEIRRRLMSNGFPDLSHEVFGRGYDGTISTELALKYMLNRWPEATRKQRRALLQELGEHWSDGC